VAVDLEIDTSPGLRRRASRRVCSDCGANYAVPDNPPRVRGICDVCGGEVLQRDDDTEAAIRHRLEIYERQTAPLIQWYEQQDLLAPIDAMGTADEVTERIVAEVDRRQRDRPAM
jgi:adenylate kinase